MKRNQVMSMVAVFAVLVLVAGLYMVFYKPLPTAELNSGISGNITVYDLEGILNEPYQFVDVRRDTEYDGTENPAKIHVSEFNHNLDYDQFKNEHSMLDVLNKSTPVVLMCNSGYRSAQAYNILLELGFKTVYNVEGGITAWINR